VRAALAIVEAVRDIGLEVRAGVHTGELELTADGVAGIAVHIGARIAGEAGAGEVLASSTVKDLVFGSGLDFEERGEAELRGVPGSWNLYAVVGS
jgi:class 3 adenylate cyclase